MGLREQIGKLRKMMGDENIEKKINQMIQEDKYLSRQEAMSRLYDELQYEKKRHSIFFGVWGGVHEIFKKEYAYVLSERKVFRILTNGVKFDIPPFMGVNLTDVLKKEHIINKEDIRYEYDEQVKIKTLTISEDLLNKNIGAIGDIDNTDMYCIRGVIQGVMQKNTFDDAGKKTGSIPVYESETGQWNIRLLIADEMDRKSTIGITLYREEDVLLAHSTAIPFTHDDLNSLKDQEDETIIQNLQHLKDETVVVIGRGSKYLPGSGTAGRPWLTCELIYNLDLIKTIQELKAEGKVELTSEEKELKELAEIGKIEEISQPQPQIEAQPKIEGSLELDMLAMIKEGKNSPPELLTLKQKWKVEGMEISKIIKDLTARNIIKNVSGKFELV